MTRNSLFSLALIMGAMISTACTMGPTTEPTSTTQQTTTAQTETSGDTVSPAATTSTSTIAAPAAPARSVIIFGTTVVNTDDGGIVTNAATTVLDSGVTTDPESVSEATCLINLTGVYTFTYTPVGGAPAKAADVGLAVYGGQRSDIYPHNQKSVVSGIECNLEQDYTTTDGNVIVSVLQGNRLSTGAPTADAGQNEDVTGTYKLNGNTWTVTAHRTGLVAGQ